MTRALAIAVIAALASGAAAAQQGCAPRNVAAMNLAQLYGEIRQGAILPGSVRPLELFVNRQSGTWTLLESRAGGRLCIIGAGIGRGQAKAPADKAL